MSHIQFEASLLSCKSDRSQVRQLQWRKSWFSPSPFPSPLPLSPSLFSWLHLLLRMAGGLSGKRTKMMLFVLLLQRSNALCHGRCANAGSSSWAIWWVFQRHPPSHAGILRGGLWQCVIFWLRSVMHSPVCSGSGGTAIHGHDLRLRKSPLTLKLSL